MNNTKKYVTNINVRINPEHATADYEFIEVDLNHESQGSYIYLEYELSETGDPITDIKFVTGENTPAPYGYTRISQDLNNGAGGDYIYLCYKKLGKNKPSDKATPIMDIMVVEGDSSDVFMDLEYGFVRINQDLNAGARGKYIYLCYKPDYDFLMSREKAHFCLIARKHDGDKNGTTNVRYAVPSLSDEAKKAGFTDVWLEYTNEVAMQESGKSGEGYSLLPYHLDPVQVITKRRHEGDENGTTTYSLAKVVAQKNVSNEKKLYYCKAVENTVVTVTNDKESKPDWAQKDGKVIIGRKPWGDENGRPETALGQI